MTTRASTAAGRRRTTGAAKPRSTGTKPPAKRPSRPRRTQAASRSRIRPSASRGAGAVALPRLPSLSVPRLRLPGSRGLRIVAIVLLALGGLYFAWFRHSSLVAARDVKVVGATTSDAPRIVAALEAAGHSQSTLDVDTSALQRAVADFPTVASVSADASFPRGLTIHVDTRPPAMVADDGSHQVAVAADGTILGGIDVPKDKADALPVLHVKEVHDSGRLGGSPLQRALAVGSAPAPLRPLVVGVSSGGSEGISVTMKGGFRVVLGDTAALARKWAAASAILADPKLDTFAYIDVTVPQRPAVGGA